MVLGLNQDVLISSHPTCWLTSSLHQETVSALLWERVWWEGHRKGQSRPLTHVKVTSAQALLMPCWHFALPQSPQMSKQKEQGTWMRNIRDLAFLGAGGPAFVACGSSPARK